MKTNEILELVRAGYTKEEISAFETETETVKTEVKTEAPTETDDPKEVIKALSNQVIELTKTIKEIQANNVNKADSGAPEVKNSDSVIRDFFGMKEGK